MTVFAYVCTGNCMAARVRPSLCNDERCDKFQEPLARVPAAFVCPGSCGLESTVPAPCSSRSCNRRGASLEARAVVPGRQRIPILDPPEGSRSYSTIFGADDVGTGHARSMIGSKQAWSARMNDTEQWMIIDAGRLVDAVGGLVVANRKDSCWDQIVTKIAIDVAAVENEWNQVDEVFDTNIQEHDHDDVAAIRFSRPVVARFVRIRPLEWTNHISLRCGLLLAGSAKASFLEVAGDEHWEVVDANQLPANVPVTQIPGGPPSPAAAPRPFDIAQLPNGECEWEGRRASWRVINFNGKDNHQNHHAFAVRPGEACSITLGYEADWNYNPNDYCPGCIVQLYYGMSNVFSTGVVEHGIHTHRGESSTNFTAPMKPGLYYITQSISLQYHFVNNLRGHKNLPSDAIAAIRVLPKTFKGTNFFLLPRSWQNQIIALMCSWNRSGADETVFSDLNKDNMYDILSFLLSSDPTEGYM